MLDQKLEVSVVNPLWANPWFLLDQQDEGHLSSNKIANRDTLWPGDGTETIHINRFILFFSPWPWRPSHLNLLLAIWNLVCIREQEVMRLEVNRSLFLNHSMLFSPQLGPVNLKRNIAETEMSTWNTSRLEEYDLGDSSVSVRIIPSGREKTGPLDSITRLCTPQRESM